jgi:hypothetical protein
LFSGWILRQVLPWKSSADCPCSKEDVNLAFLEKLWPRGKFPAFGSIWGCLPETIGLKASYYASLGDLTDLAVLVEDTALFMHEAIDV